MTKPKKASEVISSKTAKKSGPKEKDRGFSASGDVARIIPLAKGTWMYLLDPRNGRTHHLKRESEKFHALMIELKESVHGEKIEAELIALGWKE